MLEHIQTARQAAGMSSPGAEPPHCPARCPRRLGPWMNGTSTMSERERWWPVFEWQIGTPDSRPAKKVSQPPTRGRFNTALLCATLHLSGRPHKNISEPLDLSSTMLNEKIVTAPLNLFSTSLWVYPLEVGRAASYVGYTSSLLELNSSIFGSLLSSASSTHCSQLDALPMVPLLELNASSSLSVYASTTSTQGFQLATLPRMSLHEAMPLGRTSWQFAQYARDFLPRGSSAQQALTRFISVRHGQAISELGKGQSISQNNAVVVQFSFNIHSQSSCFRSTLENPRHMSYLAWERMPSSDSFTVSADQVYFPFNLHMNETVYEHGLTDPAHSQATIVMSDTAYKTKVADPELIPYRMDISETDYETEITNPDLSHFGTGGNETARSVAVVYPSSDEQRVVPGHKCLLVDTSKTWAPKSAPRESDTTPPANEAMFPPFRDHVLTIIFWGTLTSTLLLLMGYSLSSDSSGPPACGDELLVRTPSHEAMCGEASKYDEITPEKGIPDQPFDLGERTPSPSTCSERFSTAEADDLVHALSDNLHSESINLSPSMAAKVKDLRPVVLFDLNENIPEPSRKPPISTPTPVRRSKRLSGRQEQLATS